MRKNDDGCSKMMILICNCAKICRHKSICAKQIALSMHQEAKTLRSNDQCHAGMFGSADIKRHGLGAACTG